MEGCEVDKDIPLTGRDRAYLAALEEHLDIYPEIRTTDKEERIPRRAHGPRGVGVAPSVGEMPSRDPVLPPTRRERRG